ncbi:MAG: flagellar assembly protein FliW [Candidatus Omnitrophica bacterium]|nr:flagellar assembly protein FliW [Candidatus Omnitrophota bacterium]MCA9424198.1 flagellar assembly protein FliW [Candidatus Omnitrophota bacterium]MCA9430547.1 flagellar assembly protein FliW [Candidatus Omnitrophota bacterium]MCA9435162.1 flagellar assembly protein FliW [Candidatus Omnitrophota bacterium]MCA9446378.1 flagellar assembly protein FliW [Candidatus Omnitrophota bacterium]
MTETLVIQTERFGELSVPETDILHFPEGLLGFGDRKEFVLVQEAAYAPFLWLQSADDPHLSFVVVDPLTFVPDYKVEVKPAEVKSLDLDDIEKARVLVIVVVRDDPEQITANLQGPLIINPDKGMGKQIVLLSDRYHTRHYILREAEASNEEPSSGPTEESES